MNCRIYILYSLTKNGINYANDKTTLLAVMTPAKLTAIFS